MSQFVPSIPGFDVQERLAIGGMAELFLARQSADDTLVVIKQLLPGVDEVHASLFERERHCLGLIKSPHVVRLVDQAAQCMVLEYIEGTDLSRLLSFHRKRGRQLVPEIVLTMLQGLCEGLEAIHGASDEAGEALQLVHRDVNPSNVMVSEHGRVVLIDLGIVQMRLENQRTTGGIKGTLSYMAPEQLAGRPTDLRTDIYSAGMIAYEAFTGTSLLPVGSVGVAELVAARSTLPPAPSSLRPELPKRLDDVLLAALHPDPNERPDSADSWFKALADCGLVPAPPGDVSPLVTASMGGSRPVLRTVAAATTKPQLVDSEPAPNPTEPRASLWTRLVVLVLASVGLVGVGVWVGSSGGSTGPTGDTLTPREVLSPTDSQQPLVSKGTDVVSGPKDTANTPDSAEPPPQEDARADAPPKAEGDIRPRPARERHFVRLRGVGGTELHVKGRGRAPVAIGPLKKGVKVLTLVGTPGFTKAIVRIMRKRGRTFFRLVAKNYQASCTGQRSSSTPTPLMGLKKKTTCRLKSPTGATMSFQLTPYRR